MIMKSEQETLDFARGFAKKLDGGETLVFTGDLGGGKTTFTRGLAEGMKLKHVVTSPTFVIMQIYEGNPLSMYHFDLYRINSAEELYDLGFEDFVNDEKSVVVVEWGEKFPDAMPNDAIHVTFKNLGGEKREIKVTP